MTSRDDNELLRVAELRVRLQEYARATTLVSEAIACLAFAAFCVLLYLSLKYAPVLFQ